VSEINEDYLEEIDRDLSKYGMDTISRTQIRNLIEEIRSLRAQLAEHHKKHCFEMESHGEIERAQEQEIRGLKAELAKLSCPLDDSISEIITVLYGLLKGHPASMVLRLEEEIKKYRNRAEKAEALLASGVHLPEVDLFLLDPELKKGCWYLVETDIVDHPYAILDGESIKYQLDKRDETYLVRAHGPLSGGK